MRETMGNLGSNTIHLEVRGRASMRSEAGPARKGDLELKLDFRGGLITE